MVSREHNEAVDILMAGKNSNAVPLVEAGLTVPPSFVSQSFGALVERAFATILSDKKIMFLQFASYVLMAVFIGISNYDIGNDAALAMKNVSCIFFTILFTIIVGMMPTILTCMFHFFFLWLGVCGSHFYTICGDFLESIAQ